MSVIKWFGWLALSATMWLGSCDLKSHSVLSPGPKGTFYRYSRWVLLLLFLITFPLHFRQRIFKSSNSHSHSTWTSLLLPAILSTTIQHFSTCSSPNMEPLGITCKCGHFVIFKQCLSAYFIPGIQYRLDFVRTWVRYRAADQRAACISDMPHHQCICIRACLVPGFLKSRLPKSRFRLLWVVPEPAHLCRTLNYISVIFLASFRWSAKGTVSSSICSLSPTLSMSN